MGLFFLLFFSFLFKEPQSFMWAGSGAPRGKITKSGTPNLT